MASQADGCSRSALHEDSSVLPTDHFNPFDFVDDLSLLSMMKFFDRSDASRFARTNKRNYRLYKAHDLQLRPLATVASMLIEVVDRYETSLDCRNTDDSLRNKFILRLEDPIWESYTEPDFVLHTDDVEARIFTLSCRGSDDPEGYYVWDDSESESESECADSDESDTDEMDSEDSECLGVTRLFNCQVLKGDREHAIQLLAEYLLKRVHFDKLKIIQVNRQVVDFAIRLDFPLVTSLRFKFDDRCDHFLNHETATEIGIPRLLQRLPRLRDLKIYEKHELDLLVCSTFFTILRGFDSLQVYIDPRCDFRPRTLADFMDAPNLTLDAGQMNSEGVEELLRRWKMKEIRFTCWEFGMHLPHETVDELRSRIVSLTDGEPINVTVNSTSYPQEAYIRLDTRMPSRSFEKEVEDLPSAHSEKTTVESDEEVHEPRKASEIKDEDAEPSNIDASRKRHNYSNEDGGLAAKKSKP